MVTTAICFFLSCPRTLPRTRPVFSSLQASDRWSCGCPALTLERGPTPMLLGTEGPRPRGSAQPGRKGRHGDERAKSTRTGCCRQSRWRPVGLSKRAYPTAEPSIHRPHPQARRWQPCSTGEHTHLAAGRGGLPRCRHAPAPAPSCSPASSQARWRSARRAGPGPARDGALAARAPTRRSSRGFDPPATAFGRRPPRRRPARPRRAAGALRAGRARSPSPRRSPGAASWSSTTAACGRPTSR